MPIVRSSLRGGVHHRRLLALDPGNPQYKSAMVSDGGSPPTGMIPAYPTTAIFVRNLRLGIQQASAAGQWIEKQQSSSQSGGG